MHSFGFHACLLGIFFTGKTKISRALIDAILDFFTCKKLKISEIFTGLFFSRQKKKTLIEGCDEFSKFLEDPYSPYGCLKLTGNPGAKSDLLREAEKVKRAWKATEKLLMFEDWSSDLLTFEKFSEDDWGYYKQKFPRKLELWFEV